MPRVKSRPIEEVAWDLKRAITLGPKMMGCIRTVETSFADEVRCIVGGCFELLVAELLSHRVGLSEIVYGEAIQPPCIRWNGILVEGVARSAPKGVADIEIYPSLREAWVIDVTLSSSTETQVFELRRLMEHDPSLKERLNVKRVFVAPRIRVKGRNVELIEVKPIVKGLESAKPKKVSYWENTEAKIRAMITSSCTKSL